MNDIDRVDNTVLRDAVLRLGVEPGALAKSIGWMARHKGYEIGDSTRMKRTLGLAPIGRRKRDPEGFARFQQTVGYDDAVKITRALGLDPVDVGV
jgi:hypothetical protein